jgi:Phosphotransferase enzyme family
MDPDVTEDSKRIASALGDTPSRMRWASGHGAPSNRRYIVSLPSGGTAFAKVAAFDYTADWLRMEHAIYEALEGLPYLPHLLGWHDDGECPVLVIEDLSEALWPPPWDDDTIGAVLASLDELHATPPPSGIEPVESVLDDIREGWNDVRANPEPIIRSGLCSERWLLENLDVLERAADAAIIEGDALVHVDVRSDNLCLRDGRAILVDWNWASRGDPEFDLAVWLPSLFTEGGPEPWSLLAETENLASLLAGFYVAHCVRPAIPQAPHVRELQRRNAEAALAWAAHSLRLAPSVDTSST